MQIAIIDLGTNTFNLLIARVDKNNSYTILSETKYPAKIGKGGIQKRTITPEAFERGLKALQTHLDTIAQYEVDAIHCFATSAIRSAENGGDFVSKVKEKFNLDIQVIQGSQEAGLIYDGVKQVLPIGQEKVLIMDIGGGSTEFIIANTDGVVWKHSFELGAARMLELVKPSDPMQTEEIKHAEEIIAHKIAPLLQELQHHQISKLIGSSGSFDTMAAMIAAVEHPLLDMSKLTSYQISKPHFENLHRQYLQSSIQQRLKMKRMDPDRVEMIVLASIFIKFMLDHLSLDELFQCSYALKEGAIYQIINNKK
ncbi:Ppx/GppA phosphatase family protein [Saccharicrinis fermentans]|uniref:Guanosine-5'-triphosphate,3'-diphosphate pyrophosphatase n=1 Tax=Saccharicrinis fermentans DSM 9555 = JCM 21142 TaxID=869213 RepID=W7Y9A5_9BACT|nr:phosphatase [Saccharicrinis fermentans]GAF04912.1 guanosine-5'-triphosphate,3'-diphosphate pyrophosphatase [Saccharicrinis fermentans DSM 9555 = JCM 21142]